MKIGKIKIKMKISTIILTLIIVVETIVICMLANKQEETTSTTTTITEQEVSSQTIENTLTASGEISSSSTEKLTLTTSYYFKTMCVEENDEVKAGENILQYSNGTYLTAPYDCLVSSYSVPDTGSICTSSNYIEVQNLDTLTMSLSIDETEISKVSKGQEVEITVNAFEDKTYTGTISKISELGTYSASGSSYSATVTFENEDDNIKLGMSASCTVILEKAENVLCVPIAAVQTKQNEKYVIVINEDGTTSDVTIETGVSDDEYVQVTSGLTGSEKIQMIETSTTSTVKNSSSNSGFGGASSGGMGSGNRSEMQMPSGGMTEMQGGSGSERSFEKPQ